MISMWKMWLEYHKGPLLSAHDVGTGSGNAAEDLLAASRNHSSPGLRYLVLSDLRESNIHDARTRFLDGGSRFPGTEFVFRASPAEAPWDDIPTSCSAFDGGADLVMACESLHWTELEPTVRNIANGLRSGGTFAVALYWPFPIIIGNETARQAFNRFIDSRVEQIKQDQWSGLGAAWARAGKQMNLDVVPLRDEIWEDVKRVYVHCGGGESSGWAWEQHPEEDDWHAASLLHLGAYEKVDINNCADWRMTTTTDWLREMLESLRFGYTAESWESPDWRRIEEAAAPYGKIQLEWQVQMIMARKR
ncbi:hypothetical protein N0V82_005155 [Gnomoniopsis sp. IMI 355080]|nr:hypothetical protein N0V82_005155 [Gnomoniopsis sp. IMI 355080]